MEKFATIDEMIAFKDRHEKDLRLLRETISIIDRILESRAGDIGTWNAEEGKYVEYTIDEVRNGETSYGQTIWIDEETFILKRKAWDDIVNKLLTF